MATSPSGTNRMRRIVYAKSRKLRLRVNGDQSYIELAGLEEVLTSVAALQVLTVQ